MISTWKRQLLDSAAELYDKTNKSRKGISLKKTCPSFENI